jgi:hypothetical protein
MHSLVQKRDNPYATITQNTPIDDVLLVFAEETIVTEFGRDLTPGYPFF